MTNNLKAQLARAKHAAKATGSNDVEELKQANAILVSKVNALQTELQDSTNRQTARNRELLQAAIDKHGIEPCDELLRMVADNEVSVSQKIQILIELNGYRLPKMRTSEVRHAHDHNFQITLQSFSPTGEPELKDVTPRLPALEG